MFVVCLDDTLLTYIVVHICSNIFEFSESFCSLFKRLQFDFFFVVIRLGVDVLIDEVRVGTKRSKLPPVKAGEIRTSNVHSIGFCSKYRSFENIRTFISHLRFTKGHVSDIRLTKESSQKRLSDNA